MLGTTARSPRPPTCRSCSTTSRRSGHRHAQRPAGRAGQIETSWRSSRPATRTWSRSTAWTCYAGNDDLLAACWTSAARAASWWPPTWWASRCAGWSTARPRAEIDKRCCALYEALSVAPAGGIDEGGAEACSATRSARRACRWWSRAPSERRGDPRRRSRPTACSRGLPPREQANCASCRSAGWARSART